MCIEVKELCFAYGSRKILDDVNLSISEGEMVGIIGKVGSGKTTLIKHLNGLLKPFSGSVSVDGISAHDSRIIEKVGMLFQDPAKQFFARTVYEEIAFGPENLGHNARQINKEVYKALEMVGLPERTLKLSPFELSGGQMRLVALASILSMSAEYLVLDEPLSGLSRRVKNGMFTVLRKLCMKGIGVVIVSHNVEELLENVDRLIVLDGGRIRFEGTPVKYVRSEAPLLSGVPEVMRSLRECGFDVREDIFCAEDAFEQISRVLGYGHD